MNISGCDSSYDLLEIDPAAAGILKQIAPTEAQDLSIVPAENTITESRPPKD